MSGLRAVLLKDICNFEKGLTGLMKAVPGEYPLVTTGAGRRTCESYQFDTKAVCIPLVSSTGHGHASLNNVHYQEGKFALGTILVALTAKNDKELDVHFLHLYLSQLKNAILVPLMKGAANVSLSITAIKNIEIPLPSLTRQKDIIKTFEKIVKEEVLLNSELDIQKKLTGDIRLKAFQEAIEGKLSTKWRDDNPTNVSSMSLLKSINDEKKLLVAEKQIKSEKPWPEIISNEAPYELPSGWTWCHLGEVTYGFQYGTSKKSLKSGSVPVLRMGNIQKGKIILDNFVFSNDEDDIKKLNLLDGDLLFNRTNSRELVGKTAVYKGSLDAVFAGYLVRFRMAGGILSEFANIVMNSYLHKDWCSEVRTDAIGQSNINATKLSFFKFPLPSTEEQTIIVNKVKLIEESLNKLEHQVTLNKSYAEKLMNTVLLEAFAH
jgi:type I restriction enzyme S subunit